MGSDRHRWGHEIRLFPLFLNIGIGIGNGGTGTDGPFPMLIGHLQVVFRRHRAGMA